MSHQQPDRQPQRATQKDVAQRAGVSTSIVSYVINNGPRSVSEETRQRVLRAIEELGYRPYRQRQQVMREKWGSADLLQFGIVMGGNLTMLQSAFYGAVLAGIYEAAFQAGKRIRFLQFWDELKDPVLFNELIHSDEVSGLIVVSLHQALRNNQDDELLERILERVDNVVCAEDGNERFASVTYDLQQAAYKAVTHLAQLGHRRIAFIGGPDRRVVGYRNGLFDAGLDYDPTLVVHPGVVNIASEGYAGTKRLLELDALPTAIFAANDEVASGVISCLHQDNLRVPDDLAVVGVDDIEMAAFLTPPLTTVRLPKIELGRQSVQMLIDRSQHANQPPVSLVLPTELIIRQSCGERIRS
jgi:LacI family transcriptional regulator